MFGYVVANKPELKMREFYKYKAYYCGLCRTLREKYGFLGQITLSYDMTFLIVLLTSLYEPESDVREKRCLIHPLKKQRMLKNSITDYVADMNIVLTYFHLLDDWQDEKSIKGYVGMKLLCRRYRRLVKRHPQKCSIIQSCLQQLRECEQRDEKDIDRVSRCFGELMAELFAYKEDRWEALLRKVGFYLGKFVYIMDAYDDIEKDIKRENYNVLKSDYEKADFDEKCKESLNYILAECTNEFEKLPCVEDVEILRNILYAGVWTQYEKKITEKEQEKEEKNGNKSI